MLNKDEIERVRLAMENSRLNRHVCQWRKPAQVFVDGVYAMTRTDHNPKAQTIVNISNGRLSDEPEPPIRDFDSECRFFGPIPDCTE